MFLVLDGDEHSTALNAADTLQVAAADAKKEAKKLGARLIAAYVVPSQKRMLFVALRNETSDPARSVDDITDPNVRVVAGCAVSYHKDRTAEAASTKSSGKSFPMPHVTIKSIAAPEGAPSSSADRTEASLPPDDVGAPAGAPSFHRDGTEAPPFPPAGTGAPAATFASSVVKTEDDSGSAEGKGAAGGSATIGAAMFGIAAVSFLAGL